MKKFQYFLFSIFFIIIQISCDHRKDPILTLEYPHIFKTTTFENTQLNHLEPVPYQYDFAMPVQYDILFENGYNPGPGHTYFRDIYGPRELSDEFDNHAGVDIVHEGTFSGVTFDENNLSPLVSMCNGTVYKIDESNKCSVYIECDQSFTGNPEWGKIRIIYRHNSQILVSEGQKILKNDIVAIMGNCDANKPHLHLSVRPESNNNNRNVIPGRIFDPGASSYYQYLSEADIRILMSNSEFTLIRLAVPGNQNAIKEFKIVDQETGNQYVYDTEEVIKTAENSAERNDPGFVQGLEIYAYGYNGEKTACALWEDQLFDLPPEFPGSALRPGDRHFPIECDGIYGTVSLVYDLVLNTTVKDPSKLEISITDVYGRGIKTQ